VICIRKAKEATKKMPLGYLHILDSARQTKSQRSVLLETEQPILIVEGATDVLTAYDMGFVGIGKPSADSGMEHLKKMPLAGMPIWNMGENDAGAGKVGMERAYCCLSSLSDDIICIMPPIGTKDLRQWVEHGITADTLAEYVKEHGILKPIDESRIIHGTISYIRLAEQFIDGLDDRVLYHEKNWWQYGSGRYQLIDKSILESDISAWADGFQTVSDAGAVAKLKIDIKLGKEVLGAVRNLSLSRVPSNTPEPFFISTKEPIDGENTILFKNGVLDVTTDVFGSHNDDLFTTSMLHYDYDPDAVCPDWDRSLPQWFAGDTDKAALLQEWFGYNLIASNNLEAVMFLCGQSGAGKGTAVRVLSGLLCGNIGVVDALAVTKDIHCLAALQGKYACLINEEDTLNTKESKAILKLIKKISGRDEVYVRGLYKTGKAEELLCRVTYSANETPVFADEMQSLFRRLNLLKFDVSFMDNPDNGLKGRLQAQLPGIANWAIMGLKRLLANGGKFTQPEASRIEIEAIKEEASPFRTILEMYISYSDPTAFLSRRELFNFYVHLCRLDGIKYTMKFNQVRGKVQAASKRLHALTDRYENERGYKGARLNKAADVMRQMDPPDGSW
jgi:P4 family phage/plasmid primase-like protien